MNKVCETCKYWETYHSTFKGAKNVGICNVLVYYVYGTDDIKNASGMFFDGWILDELESDLQCYTKATFGCNEWQEL